MNADATSRPVAVFVLGFGRSGTSALTRVLSLCGATLPPGLLGASKENPRGFFEPRAAIHLNERILQRSGRSGYDLSLDPVIPADGVGAQQAVADITAYLNTVPKAPVVVIKEPKTTMVSGLWFEAARRAGFDVVAAVAVRHPQEVIGSIASRANRYNYIQSSPELTGAWWLKFSLLAERDTRRVPRVFVDYDNLMTDWRREVKRISGVVGADLEPTDAAAIDAFLAPELRHHRHSGSIQEPFGTDWLSVVHESLSAAACDQPWDESALDRVFEAYGAAERGFSRALHDAERYRNVNRVLRPSLIKLGLEAMALAHGRKGTWS